MSEMDKRNSEINYNSGNATPAFAKIAELQIKNGNFERAITLLKNGIEKFPNYASPYFLYGKTLLTLGKKDEAKNAFQSGIDLAGFSETTAHYMSLIPDTSTTQPDAEVVEDIHEVLHEDAEAKDDLVYLADKLRSAKMDTPLNADAQIDAPKKSDETISPNRGLVSETLARIYVSQENYKEAKEIYETLIEIQPEREDYFKGKLAEIDAR